MNRFCWHDWTKWGKIIQDYTPNRFQFRSCKKCNKVVRRKAFWNNSIKDEDINECITKDNR